jgi:hypothetical protein
MSEVLTQTVWLSVPAGEVSVTVAFGVTVIVPLRLGVAQGPVELTV